MNTSTSLAGFDAAFAKAVVDFITTENPQGVCFDRKSGQFEAYELESGTSPEDVAMYVSDGWQSVTGKLAVTCDPTSKDFSAATLYRAIVEAVQDTPKAAQWAEYVFQDAHLQNDVA